MIVTSILLVVSMYNKQLRHYAVAVIFWWMKARCSLMSVVAGSMWQGMLCFSMRLCMMVSISSLNVPSVERTLS